MMASFLLVDLIVRKNNKQTEKNMPLIASDTQIHINPEKNTSKNIQMTT